MQHGSLSDGDHPSGASNSESCGQGGSTSPPAMPAATITSFANVINQPHGTGAPQRCTAKGTKPHPQTGPKLPGPISMAAFREDTSSAPRHSQIKSSCTTKPPRKIRALSHFFSSSAVSVNSSARRSHPLSPSLMQARQLAMSPQRMSTRRLLQSSATLLSRRPCQTTWRREHSGTVSSQAIRTASPTPPPEGLEQRRRVTRSS